jgi:hypothetical protein
VYRLLQCKTCNRVYHRDELAAQNQATSAEATCRGNGRPKVFTSWYTLVSYPPPYLDSLAPKQKHDTLTMQKYLSTGIIKGQSAPSNPRASEHNVPQTRGQTS